MYNSMESDGHYHNHHHHLVSHHHNHCIHNNNNNNLIMDNAESVTPTIGSSTTIGSGNAHHQYVILSRNVSTDRSEFVTSDVTSQPPSATSSSTAVTMTQTLTQMTDLTTPSVPSVTAVSNGTTTVTPSISKGSSSTESSSSLGNDKSPMCLINELSRCNNITHQYHLIDENGPPHQKTFTVILKLGDTEEYRASGPSIRSAQRSAATMALQQTRYPHPVEKPMKNQKKMHKSPWPLTPTVELNVLAMRRGERAVYHVIDPPRLTPPPFHFTPTGVGVHPSGHGPIGSIGSPYDYRGMHYQRYHVPRGLYTAQLTVGSKVFVGRGRTGQSARHSAAEEALKVLRDMPLPDNRIKTSNANTSDATPIGDSDSIGGTETPVLKVHESVESSHKSPISLVHELALKRSLPVKFEVINQTGPSHLPLFVTRCTVGDTVTTGEGNGKKISKKISAEKMLIELEKFDPSQQQKRQSDVQSEHSTTTLSNGQSQQRPKQKKKQFPKKKRPNIIKDTVSGQNTINKGDGGDCDDGNVHAQSIGLSQSSPLTTELTIHPINRLIQLQQAKREREPQFTLINENVNRRRREFTIECSVTVNSSGGPSVVTAIGIGPNKKIAKKNAAESMLHQLGYLSKPSAGIKVNDNVKMNDDSTGQCSGDGHSINQINNKQKIRKVKFIDDPIKRASCGRQLVPGLILMPADAHQTIINCTALDKDEKLTSSASMSIRKESFGNKTGHEKSNDSTSGSVPISVAGKIAGELLDSGTGSPTARNISGKGNCPDVTDGQLMSSYQKLKYLSETVGSETLQVHFSDFPKKSLNNDKIEYLSVVTITHNQCPLSAPIVSHGIGLTQDEARDQASHQALSALSSFA